MVNKQQYENIQSWPCLFTGPAAGWHLDYIDVKDEAMDQTFRFPCDRWLAKNDDDGETMRELACANNDSIDLSDKTSESWWSRITNSLISTQFSGDLTYV